MTTLVEPHVALNDPRAPVVVRMWRSYRLGATEARENIVDRVVQLPSQVSRGRLRHVVINCHGSPGHLQLGQGFSVVHADLFAAWQGKVDKIWIRACRIAGRPNAHTGTVLPRAIARAAQCHVVASTELQVEYRNRRLPYGQLDTFEGLVQSFAPSGVVTWSHRYPSTYRDAEGHLTRNPD